MVKLTIGVLGLQGDFREHLWALQKLQVETIVVKTVEDLRKTKGLIIPGGESTTIGKLARLTGIADELEKLVDQDFPIYGTCAGMILLAKQIVNYPYQYSFGFMDIVVERNAYGRQVESFEVNLDIPSTGGLFKAIFIRAPKIVEWGEGVEVLARYGDSPVLVRQGNLLASSFHPELGQDLRIHKYFLEMAGVKHAGIC
ncbi:SNO glutamine amidotransferase [Pseudothermotoga lettingae TMO]|jgi:5'-phosphate synthase pdxT subunit|nr:SNO glutamine amidotransferase [Pseudothermotoga lettingae TMO]KUK20267.1 MAG: Glutamine amidotransferase subunit PdxT [Pseudothermotoga lettingae]MDK2885025.1 pyridoxal 5-phosphate synthase pdxT subunit [Pseudothermotoga sp.]